MSAIELMGNSPLLIGEDLRLRRFTISDANELAQLHQDESMTRWLLDDVALDNTAITDRFILGLRRYYQEHPGLGIWAFERLLTRYTKEQLIKQGADKVLSEQAFAKLLEPSWQLHGWFNLTQVPGSPELIELGSRLHRSSWGQRIACAVGEQLVSYAFDTLSCSSLYLHCHPQNQPALYCAAYLGFEDPTPVKFLGRDALKLVSQAERLLAMQAKSDSQRRRHAVKCVNHWISPGYRISA